MEYEYRTLRINGKTFESGMTKLNKLGSQGWELVTVTPEQAEGGLVHRCWLKRVNPLAVHPRRLLVKREELEQEMPA